MSKFALVSTVDTLGEDFPCYCVMIFTTEQQAIEHAISLLEKYDERVVVNDYWYIGTEQYSSAEEFLDGWQCGLNKTEYFHIMPIVEGSQVVSRPQDGAGIPSASEDK